MRVLSSSTEFTRMWRRKVLAIFEKAHSIRLNAPLDRFLVQFERLLVALFGELEPDEETAQHDERNDDERTEHQQKERSRELQDLHRLTSLPDRCYSRVQPQARDLGFSPLKSGAWAIMASTSSDRKSTRLNSSHANISYAVFCL